MARVLVLPKRSALVRFELNPAQTIVVGFATIVLAGAFLLSLPVASAAGRPVPFLTALFTATSATCVTGLVVVDTATYFSLFGQLVIVLLIQLGGLGYMTVATLMAMLIGRRIGLRDRLVLQEAHNLYTMGGVVRFTRTVVLATLAIETVGALILAWRWIPEFGLTRGVYYGVFHSISAFNNAGFDLMCNFRRLTRYVADPTVNLSVAGWDGGRDQDHDLRRPHGGHPVDAAGPARSRIVPAPAPAHRRVQSRDHCLVVGGLRGDDGHDLVPDRRCEVHRRAV